VLVSTSCAGKKDPYLSTSMDAVWNSGYLWTLWMRAGKGFCILHSTIARATILSGSVPGHETDTGLCVGIVQPRRPDAVMKGGLDPVPR